jgi:hypothetical protein
LIHTGEKKVAKITTLQVQDFAGPISMRPKVVFHQHSKKRLIFTYFLPTVFVDLLNLPTNL